MKKIALVLLILISCNCYGLTLNHNEALVLEQFLRTLLLHSEGGYVLYDAKPVCINGFHATDFFTGENQRHKEDVDLHAGATIWKKISINKLNNDITLHVYNQEDLTYFHVLFINKPLFIKTVQENLALFRYVLGISITPEKLLAKLTDSEETFHSVLKGDTVLIGIILGFGTQNSLYGSRTEYLQNQLLSDERPPLKNALLKCESINEIWKKEFLINSHQGSYSPAVKNLESNFSISSIQKEISESINLMTVSSPQLSENLPNFIFGRLKEDKETELLIPKLENAQKKIISLLTTEKFLENVLKMIFPMNQLKSIISVHHPLQQ